MLRLLLIVVTSCLVTLAHGQQLHFDVFSRSEGLSSSGVYDLMEDNQGYLWIATEGGGLCRFDGFHFEVWDRSRGLTQLDVRCLYESRDGRIWAGLPGDGLFEIIGDSAQAMTLPEGMPEVHVRSITEDDSGRMFVGTFGQGLLELDGSTLKTVDVPQGFHSKIRTAVSDQAGRCWFGTDNGLWRYANGTWDHFVEELPSPKVLCSFVDGNFVAFGTESGAILFDKGEPSDDIEFSLGDERIRSIAVDAKGSFWFGTKNGAIKKSTDIHGNVLTTVYTVNNGLSNNRIRKILRDSQGRLWFGTFFGGICALEDEQFAIFDSSQGFPEENVTSTLISSGGNLWFGTYAGDLFEMRRGVLFERYTHRRNEDVIITALAEKADGTILVGTDGKGLLSWDGSRLKSMYPHKETGRIQAIAIRGDHMLVAGSEMTIDYGFFWEDVTKLSPLRKVNTAYFDSDNSLWLGTPRGLFRTDWIPEEGVFSRFTRISGTAIMNVTCITETARGQIWFGSEGSGVLRVLGDSFQSYRNVQDLRSFVVNFVCEDRDSSLWVGTPNGLHHLILDSSGNEIEYSQHFDADEGFVGVETNPNAASVDLDGFIWCGTTQGIARIDLNARNLNRQPPEVRLSAAHYNLTDIELEQISQGLALEDILPLDPYENEFMFQWKAISLTHPEKLRYRVKLEGHDGQYRPSQSSAQVIYNNLGPGEYTLKIQASVDGLSWSKEASLASFCMKPPFYETWWFRILAIALIAAAVYAVVQIRLGILRQENRKLERKVAERTREVREEQARSERLLLNILPKETAEELKRKGQTDSRLYKDVSVLFTDFKGFTQLSETLDSDLLVKTLDRYFRSFDSLTSRYGVEKIKTIGDAYMCASGIPSPCEDHAQRLVGFACALRDSVLEINDAQRSQGLPAWDIRIGIHSGSVVAGVVGEKKFAYDIWGDTVNVAARMESSGGINEVNISQDTFELIKDSYECQPRGAVEAKNKGHLEMYFVRASKNGQA